MKRILIIISVVFITSTLYPQTSVQKGINHIVIDSYIGENTEYRTPYYILRSDKEYPKILIDAGIHGDEIAGIYACDTVMKYINVIEGTVGFVPKVNIKAFEQNIRGVDVDLNQVFPGSPAGEIYEERLAYDFMEFVNDFRPDYVINLHEAWTKFNENLYNKQNDKSFGQTIITNNENFPVFLTLAKIGINLHIDNPEHHFRIQYFPYKPNHSMDNIIEKLHIPSYTVETLRILPLEQRINYQILAILSFLEQAGIQFTYK
jgi:succinylglutamate desuccinylase